MHTSIFYRKGSLSNIARNKVLEQVSCLPYQDPNYVDELEDYDDYDNEYYPEDGQASWGSNVANASNASGSSQDSLLQNLFQNLFQNMLKVENYP